MLNSKIISLKELSKSGSTENLNNQALALLENQKSTWKIAADNFKVLKNVQTRDFDFGHFKITTQFNSGRILSSAAKTDAKSIAGRPCFLCIKNLPPEQRGILFQNKYLILVNPYPVFSQHFTISSLEHTPQEILPHFADLLDLNRNLPGFTIFYNGPQCGASAPDHFHFQAVPKNSLPVETEFALLEEKYSEAIFDNEKLKILAVENYLRRFFAIISGYKNQIINRFEILYKNLILAGGGEPMMNILCSYQDKKWRVIIFPRNKQRSSHFFRTGTEQIVVSPAAVELGGVLILPREGDFEKIGRQLIAEIYEEVTISNEAFSYLKNRLKN